jgi:hypothetical protein
MSSISRRAAIARTASVAGALAASSALPAAQLWSQATTEKPRPAPLAPDLVREFVVSAHTNLEKTKTMVEAEPGLINATWDWGGGDFETALGGASHMGRPDIAAFLLSKGARMDLFCATMMGKAEVVRSCIADNPAIVQVKGPHGITLLRHAVMGKQDAIAAVLKEAGAT